MALLQQFARLSVFESSVKNAWRAFCSGRVSPKDVREALSAVPMPSAEGSVVDPARLLDPKRSSRMQSTLRELAKKNGVHGFVLLLPSVPRPLNAYADDCARREFVEMVFQKWNMKRRIVDNGLLIVIFQSDGSLIAKAGGLASPVCAIVFGPLLY